MNSMPEMSKIGIGHGVARSEDVGVAGASPTPPPSQTVPTAATRGSQLWPPVILIGGENNALSVARSLSVAGIEVYAINYPDVPAVRSRRLTHISAAGDNVESWRNYLLSAASDHLKGAAIFCCSDEAIKLVIENWPALSARYLLEPCPPETRLCLLDKLSTYESASACGLAHPTFWRLEPGQGITEVARTCRFPVILKPRLSPLWRRIGAKYLRADNAEELQRQYQRCVELDIAVVAMEFIPGADDRNCSYFTYIDETGSPLFHFTKRIVRRHPVNEGGATYHVTDWNPEVAEKGLRLLRHVGLRGQGNVEFKRDPRDGELKLIEVNARFVNGNALITLSGFDQALLSYSQLTGMPYVMSNRYDPGLVMLDPIPDFLAFCALRARGEITLAKWLRQVARADITLNFDWRDPLPGLHYLVRTAHNVARLVSSRRRANPEQAIVAAALKSESGP
jgi:predicted ATP-grasp superfamily ATP-dependent carboligase